MAKDRFKTRASYDSTFKYGITEYEPTSKRTITGRQVSIMRQMYNSNKLNSWEKNFVKSCMKLYTLTDKQKNLLNKLYKNGN